MIGRIQRFDRLVQGGVECPDCGCWHDARARYAEDSEGRYWTCPDCGIGLCRSRAEQFCTWISVAIFVMFLLPLMYVGASVPMWTGIGDSPSVLGIMLLPMMFGFCMFRFPSFLLAMTAKSPASSDMRRRIATIASARVGWADRSPIRARLMNAVRPPFKCPHCRRRAMLIEPTRGGSQTVFRYACSNCSAMLKRTRLSGLFDLSVIVGVFLLTMPLLVFGGQVGTWFIDNEQALWVGGLFGMMLGFAIGIAILTGLRGLFRIQLYSVARRPGFCLECDYDLRGADHGHCPECGTQCDHVRLKWLEFQVTNDRSPE